MPPTTTSSTPASFSGLRSGNISRCATDSKPFDDVRRHDIATVPLSNEHSIEISESGLHVIPFFMLSGPMYSKYIARTLNTKFFNTAIDPSTYFPTGTNDEYNLSSGVLRSMSVNIDSLIEIVVPRKSQSGIVIDLNELSAFTNAIYENSTSAAPNPDYPGRGIIYSQLTNNVNPTLQQLTGPTS